MQISVELTEPRRIDREDKNAGDVVTIEQHDADSLLARGLAKKVTQKKPTNKATAD